MSYCMVECVCIHSCYLGGECISRFEVTYVIYGNDKNEAPTFLAFCRRLAWQLIQNIWLIVSEMESQFMLAWSEHTFLVARKHAKEYHNRRWVCTAVSKYQQYKCSLNCGQRVRAYCACTPSLWVCSHCHAKHVLLATSEP